MKSRLNTNIWREVKSSQGRFWSITALIALAVFVFVGLKATSPDMRNTVREGYTKQKLADAKINNPTSDGFSKHEKNEIEKQSYVKKAEYAYQTDAKIDGKQTAVQLISKPKSLSKMEVTSGHLPKQQNEIALGEQLKVDYKIGDTIKLSDNHNKKLGTLNGQTYKVTGFVRSAQYMKKHNLANTKVGDGEINGFGVMTNAAFTGKPNIVQVSFNNVHGAAYSDQYEYQARRDNEKLQKTLRGLSSDKQADKRKEADAKIKQAESKQKEAKQAVQAAQGTPMASQAKAALQKVDGKLAEAKDAKNGIDQLKYTSETRQSYSTGYSEFGSDADRVHELSNTFPIFFFAVALMVSFVTMQRMADVKRTEVGTLRALGYSHMQALREFIIYSVLVATTGTALGAIVGLVVLPKRIFEAFGSNFFTGAVVTNIAWWPILISYGLALLSTVFPAVRTTYHDMREQAATQMLPKPPANGQRILLERWTWLWSKLSFFNKVTIRNIFRYKLRMWMTILGVAGSIALLITGFGIRDSLDKIVPLQYNQLVHYDVTGVYNPDASKQERDDYHQAINDDKNVKGSTDVHTDNLTATVKGLQEKQPIQLLVPEKVSDFNEYMTLRDYKNKDKLKLKDNEAIVSEKLAKIEKLKVGDTMTVNNTDGSKHKVKIGAIAEMYAGHTIVMNKAYYQKVFDDQADANASLIRLKHASAKKMHAMTTKLNKQDAAVSATQLSSIRNDINLVLDSLNQVVFVIIVAAALLAFTVLFTLTNINVSERMKELSTLKVLGFYPKEVLNYIYRETAVLTAVGILLGFSFGYAVHAYLMKVVMPENVLSAPGVSWLNLGISTLMIVIFALVVMWLMARKINRVDMLEALK